MSVSMLSRKAFEAARGFVFAQARPLEIARFEFAFEAGSVEPVYAALRGYQNSDGGFGHALEPDLRTEESSALCATIAFQILRSTSALLDQAFAVKGIQFFLETLDRAEAHWRIIPPSAESSPHAPWWNQAGRENELNSFALNPTAEVLGYLYDFKDLVPSDILSSLSDRVLNHLAGLETIKMHDLLCCLRLLQTETLPMDLRKALQRKVTDLIPKTVERNPGGWSGYSLRPLQVVDDPGSPFMGDLREAVEANLDFEISSQNPDGSWTPAWTWGGTYPEDWTIAQREWSGMITFDKLLLLQRFGRIEGIV